MKENRETDLASVSKLSDSVKSEFEGKVKQRGEFIYCKFPSNFSKKRIPTQNIRKF
jgi:hypothetical protein